MTKEMITQPVNSSVMTNSIDRLDSVTVREKDVFANREELGCVSTSEYQLDIFNHRKFQQVPPEINVEHIEGDMPHQKPSFLGRMKSSAVLEQTYVSRSYAMFGINLNQQYRAEADAVIAMSPAEADDILCACKAIVERDGESVWKGRDEEKINDSGRCKGNVGNLPYDAANAIKHDISISMKSICSNDMLPIFDNEKISHVKGQGILSEELISVDKKQQKAQNPRLQALAQCEAVENCKNYCTHTEKQHCKRNNCLSIKQKYEHKRHTEDKKVNSKEVGGNFFSSILKNKVEPKILPDFEYFTAEEEEGSGGYGTVYRARRKHDGLTLAIKCPHDNANRHHIQNELKMLERFGGKNFVIKYEGSFKYGNVDCLMLEHVEHDRPEVLKREIDISQLQWYGYCLFRALAGLHKMGVFHRDVKPGNFLFSRKVIDFNLAMDLHQKYATTDKLARSYDMSFTQPLPKNLKRKANQATERATLSTRNVIKSQGADGSGITSTKDATSTRIPSAERMREPVPSQGRKELISLAQEAMNSPNLEMTSTPASKRKRVAAPPERLDRKTVYLSPMPLQSAGIAVAGAGLIKSRWDGKHKKEGPCVGTKGFRAPEVLFKSSYQGPKIDIWSAGVTLLYLITGRSPFVGDPDQNIKDIAKLRGTEDLWEVAKLHNRESSFPTELYDMQFLPSKKLRDWCGLHTKRPDVLEVVPRCFFDLVDKCLTVNPRLRISSEEALRHEFFAPCHEQLRKQRLLRQALNSDSGTSLP